MTREIRRIAICALFAFAGVLGGPWPSARSETCPPEQFGEAVDAAAAKLRALNAEAQPKLKDKLSALKDKKGWDQAGYEEKGLDYLYDARIAEYDAKAGDLLSKVDTLGRPDPAKAPSCTTLAELKAAGDELLGVMRAKSEYLIGKIDQELGSPAAQTTPPPEAAAKPETKVAKVEPAPAPPPKAPAEVRPAPMTASKEPPPPVQKKAEEPLPWDTSTEHTPSTAYLPPPGEPYVPPDALPYEAEDGYTIDEIREATRGFFGTISTSLASVMEHAFKEVGRPTAYVLGTEGGGALLAGLRYGSGNLYLRTGGTEKVYWHGPSIGYDLGADGSRTLFLIYRLRDAPHLYRMYTGVDGTAYLVGGVGMTLLKGGDVIMAPIRSGLGLRLGASVGYVRFTPYPTWNPF